MLEIIHCSSKLVEWPLLCFEIKMKKDVKRKKLLNQNELFITISLSFAFKSILVPNGGISPFPQSRPNLFALIFFHLNFLFTVPLIFQEVFVYSPYFFQEENKLWITMLHFLVLVFHLFIDEITLPPQNSFTNCFEMEEDCQSCNFLI